MLPDECRRSLASDPYGAKVAIEVERLTAAGRSAGPTRGRLRGPSILGMPVTSRAMNHPGFAHRAWYWNLQKILDTTADVACCIP